MKTRGQKWHSFLEWTFLIMAYAMTGVTMYTVVAMVFCENKPTLELLEINSNLYFICLFLYAGARQIRRRVWPVTKTNRPNEIVVAVWILIGIGLAGWTTFNDHDLLTLLKQVVYICLVTTIILSSNEAAKLIFDRWFGPPKTSLEEREAKK